MINPKAGEIVPSEHVALDLYLTKLQLLEELLTSTGYIERIYCNHLSTMSEDCTFKPADRQKLKAYTKQWSDYKVLCLVVPTFLMY